jgi:hypothetical protein
VSIHPIAMEHRVTHGFAKREFNELLLVANTTGSSDQTHEPVDER